MISCVSDFSWIKPHAKKYFVNDWTAIIVWVILGICYRRQLSNQLFKRCFTASGFRYRKIFSSRDEELKDKLLVATQDINELFKMNFQRFGLAVVPALLIGIVDNGETQVINSEGKKLSVK